MIGLSDSFLLKFKVKNNKRYLKERCYMGINKYTLNQIEDGYAMFLKYPDENEQVFISLAAMDKPLKEGDLVTIEEQGDVYHIEVLIEETKLQHQKIADRIKQLREQTE